VWIIKQKDKTCHCFSMKFVFIYGKQAYADILEYAFSAWESSNK